MWLFNGNLKHLPKSTGPYVPGCVDVMLDYNARGIFMRLFYPTNYKDDDQTNSHRWIPWIPNESYTQGISEVLMTFLFLVRTAFWWGMKYIPVIYGAKPKTDKKLKCVIFSHGLGGARFLNSTICYELASRGYLVVALEHRDHSACYTYCYDSKENAQNNTQTPIGYWKIELGKNHFERRHKQVSYRANECCTALDFLLELNKGNVAHNVLSDVENNLNSEISLQDFVGKLDVESVTVSGHSFGASTALLALSKRNEFKQGILLDPWMFPLKNEDLELKLKQPILFINTQTFHIATNVKAMSKFLTDDNRKMYTILHTTHENQTDSVFIVGYWLNWFMKKLDPLKALKINNSLILEFLDQYGGCPVNINDCRMILEQEKSNIDVGLTKPWA